MPKAATDLSVLLAGIEAKVDGRMTAKLWETASGATVWSNSSWGTWTIGGVSFDSKGRVSAGYSYPMENKGKYLLLWSGPSMVTSGRPMKSIK